MSPGTTRATSARSRGSTKAAASTTLRGAAASTNDAPEVAGILPSEQVKEWIHHAHSVSGPDDVRFVRELRKKFLDAHMVSGEGALRVVRSAGRAGDVSHHIYEDPRFAANARNSRFALSPICVSWEVP